MKRLPLTLGLLFVVLSLLPGSTLLAQTTTLATAFAYQGYLTNAGGPVTGSCDLRFSLFNAPSAGTQIGNPLTQTNVLVSNGVFNVPLDFGVGAFNGTDRYLQIAVRCPAGSGTYTPLTPRQALTPTPYALGLYGLQVQSNATSPNLIGGYFANGITANVHGATISGGGNVNDPNRVTDDYGVIGGGAANQAGDNAGTNLERGFATVGGGFYNRATGNQTTVAGGYTNTASGAWSTVGGGDNNTASGPLATVGGGFYNRATGNQTTVAGGYTNTASGQQAAVGGGYSNSTNGSWATVAGGNTNTASGLAATVSGGYRNTASYWYTTVGGGNSNTASGGNSTVGGGGGNTASGDNATVGGGGGNTASGYGATVAGGWNNIASGSYSFAAGRRAQADRQGAFIWGDSTNVVISSWLDNQFIARASGGVWFYTNGTSTVGARLVAGSGSWASISDRNLKANFTPVDGRNVLDKVVALPLSTWNYQSQDAGIRHIGPMAQDFAAAFGVGEDDRHISTVDADGVALAAIQGLYQITQEQQAQLQTKDKRIVALERQVDNLNARLNALEKLAGGVSSPMGTNLPWLLIGGFCVGGVFFLRKWRPVNDPKAND